MANRSGKMVQYSDANSRVQGSTIAAPKLLNSGGTSRTTYCGNQTNSYGNGHSNQATSRYSVVDKKTGSYVRTSLKESSSAKNILERSTGRVGIKEEQKRTSTFKCGDKNGYSEYQKEEKFTTTNFGNGNNYNNSGQGSNYNNSGQGSNNKLVDKCDGSFGIPSGKQYEYDETSNDDCPDFDDGDEHYSNGWSQDEDNNDIGDDNVSNHDDVDDGIGDDNDIDDDDDVDDGIAGDDYDVDDEVDSDDYY